jgi:hypothetical protein
MTDEAFVERNDKAIWTWHRGRKVARPFSTVGLVAMAVAVLGVGIGRADENKGQPAVKTGVAVTSQEDALLWRAATTSFYYHNGVLVLPEDSWYHDPLLTKYLRGGRFEDRRERLALMIRRKDDINEVLRALVAVEQEVQSELLPAAIERTRGKGFLDRLIPGEGDSRVPNVKRPTLPSIDELRKTKVEVNRMASLHHLVNDLIAEDAEVHYRKALGDKKLPADARFHFREKDHGRVEIAYMGATALTNVVVVARAKMRSAGPKAEATRRLINLINETADPGADANKVAAQLLDASKALHETAQAAFVYIPVLEPGDDLAVDMYEHGFYWDVQEAKVSVYSDDGGVLDKVMFVGGPHNDLSLSAEERQRLTKPPPKEKPLGPTFRMDAILEIVLKKEAAGPIERCVPVGDIPVSRTYLPIAVKDAVVADKPLEVIARSATAYVVVGPKKPTGNALLLVPKSAVAKINDLSKKDYGKRKVQLIEKPTWLVLKPPADGSTDHQFETAYSVVDNVCTLLGGKAGIAVGPDGMLRAVAVGDNEYVALLPKPLKDNNVTLVVVPKSAVKEVKGNLGGAVGKADSVRSWKCECEIGGQKRTSTLMIKKDGDKLAGTMSWPDQKDEKLRDVKLKDRTLTFSVMRKFMGNEIPVDFTFTIDGDKIKGKGEAVFGGKKREFDVEVTREKQDK